MSRSSVGKILSHSAENFHWGILYYWSFFGYRKSLDNKGGGGVSRFSFENILSHSTENFRRLILSCFINFGYRKGLDKRGGSIKIFRGSFLFHSAEKFRRGTI